MRKQLIIQCLLAIVLSIGSTACFAQNPTDSLPGDPALLSVYTVQNINFGAFTQGSSGGTVILSNTGTRSTTGTVIPLNLSSSYFQAVFEIECPESSIISIINGPDCVLSGSNGGSMSLHLTDADRLSPFVASAQPTGRTQINIGGILTVGNAAASPPGNYSGSFYILFNQE